MVWEPGPGVPGSGAHLRRPRLARGRNHFNAHEMYIWSALEAFSQIVALLHVSVNTRLTQYKCTFIC